MAGIRELARGIRPPVLNEEGLGPALVALADRMPLPVTADVRIEGRLPDVIEATGYFAAGEALANVLKHADARFVRLTACEEDGAVVLTVADDGHGGAHEGNGSGLVGLADRLAAVGGSLSVHSPQGGGTTVVARLPARAAQPTG